MESAAPTPSPTPAIPRITGLIEKDGGAARYFRLDLLAPASYTEAVAFSAHSFGGACDTKSGMPPTIGTL